MYFLNSYTNVEIIGYVGSKPEVSTVGSENRSLCKLSIATRQTVNKESEIQTLWHQVIAWGKTAESVEKVISAGDLIRVSAKIGYNEWTDQHEQKRKDVQFVLDEFVVLKRKEEQAEKKTGPEEEKKS